MLFPTSLDTDNSNVTKPHLASSFALRVNLQHYHVPIIITAHDRPDLIRDVATTVADVGANVLLIKNRVRRGIATITATLDIEGLDMLYRLFTKLEKLKGVTRIERDLGARR